MQDYDKDLTIEEKATNAETWKHIENVMSMIATMQISLGERMFTHDRSKLHRPEVDTFAKYTPKLAGMTYGSDEYRGCLKEMQPALEHHYRHNRHHPEHFKDGINAMNLIDIIEMFCDWYAATMRHDDGDIMKSIEINHTRFDMSDQLRKIFENTVEMLNEEANVKS